MRSLSHGVACFVAIFSMFGCGGGDDPAQESGGTGSSTDSGQTQSSSGNVEQNSASGTDQIRGIPTAAIPSLNDDEDANEQADVNVKRPDKGTAEWFILQIIELKQQPLPESDDVEKQRAARKERNQKIVEFATSAIAETHDKKEKEQVFNIAVHRLMDATYQLAMQGDQDSVNALYEHADSLFARDPQSRAAREASWVVTRFANENARRFASQDPRWLKEFSQQARMFGERFPDDQRGAKLLHDAAVSCDLWGETTEAVLCYKALAETFPKSAQAVKAVAPLRRLTLVGKQLDLGGPTVDGAFLTVKDFKGSPLLIAFWSTQAKTFVDNVDTISKTVAKYEARGLQVLAVNLDTDEGAVDAFVEKTGLGWRTLFHADPAKRGWNHPVAAYYGVSNVPQFWFVNPDGKVVTTNIELRSLDASIGKLMPAGD